MRSFALGELGWSLKRYLSATINEFNESARGYWRKWEREAWHTRELIWWGIMGNPYIKSEDKPKRRDEIMKLSIDEVEKKKKLPNKITPEDIKIFEQLQYNKK